jgi:hypothetical protein
MVQVARYMHGTYITYSINCITISVNAGRKKKNEKPG